MDKTVPAGAAYLLDFIGQIEAPKGYDTVYGNNQNKLPKRVTSMRLYEIQEAQPSWTKRFGSSATGRYQFMRNTLRGLITELKLSNDMKLDPNLQDRLAYHLLRRRGYDAFVFGRIDTVEFAKRLAMEWASLPVLKNTRGAHRNVVRGQTYYAGDGLNKSLTTPERVEAALAKVLELHKLAPAAPRVKPSRTGTVATGAAAAGAGVATVAAGGSETLKAVTDTAEAFRPVSEALSGLAAVPVSVWLAAALIAGGAALGWYLYKRSKTTDGDTE